MKKSSRLQPVVQVAENREQMAAQALGNAQLGLAASEQRLNELKRYREEYVRRFHDAGAIGMGANKLEDFRKFLANLSQAIDQQVRVVAQAARGVEDKRRHWLSSRSKTQILDTVVSRYQAEEQRQADRKEQRELDELVQQRFSIER